MIRITLLFMRLLRYIVERRRRGMVSAVVPVSLVFQSNRMDAGYFLGTNEENDLLKVITYIEIHLPSTWRRFKGALRAYILSRWRLYRWAKHSKLRFL